MRLIISTDFSGDEVPASELRLIIEKLSTLLNVLREGKTKIALVRDGDRSAKNLLLPKLDGRLGEHYQDRKATLEEAYSFLFTVLDKK